MVPGCKRVRRLFHASENSQGPAFCAAGADAGESFDRLRRIEAGVFPVYGLADEKDMVYIIAHADEKAAIMRAIHENAGPGTKAGAICFTLPISSVAGLREREKDEG